MATTDFLHGVEVVDIDDEIRPIRTLRSSIIGLVGSAGKGALNTPIAITNRREAVLAFGAWNNADGFTLPGALDAIYDQGGAVVVAINVNDIVANKTAVDNEACTLNRFSGTGKLAHGFVSSVAIATSMKALLIFPDTPAATITLPAGITVTAVKSSNGATTYVAAEDYSVSGNILTNLDDSIPQGATVEVTYTATVALGTDYTVDSDAGTIQRVLSGSKILAGSVLTVDYNYVDSAQVTEADVIGGVNQNNGNYEGVHALLAAKSQTGLQPRILLAPGFTHQKPDANTANAVVSEMLAIAERLKGIILADGPSTNDDAAYQYRSDWGNKRVYVLDPRVKVRAPDGTDIMQNYSARMAGVIASNDALNGFWSSPSNKEIKGIIGVERAVEFALGDTTARANLLNEQEICTIIREEGFRTWGNRGASADPKWAFISVVRTNDMIAESIMQAHLWAVDRNITKQFVEAVVEGVNAYLRYLKNLGAILGGKAWADPALNTPDVIANGQLFIDYDFTPPFPAERITFRSHLVNNYVAEIFD